MHTSSVERRRRRSQNPQLALSFQLEHVRDEAHIDALVLASDEGLSLAYSGEDELCTELAALAPFFSRDAERGANGETLRVVRVADGSLPLYLVSYCRDETPDELELWLDHASRGCLRILAI